MNQKEPRPDVEPLSDLAVARIERGVLAALASTSPSARLPERLAFPRRQWMVMGGVAAVAVAACALLWVGLGNSTPQSVREAIATPAPLAGAPGRVVTSSTSVSLSFADAVLEIAPLSIIDLHGDATVGGRVDLERGEVHAKVAPRGPRPPLTVAAGEVLVTVIGTQFTVRRDGAVVVVEVEEGTVQIDHLGQLAIVHSGATWTTGVQSDSQSVNHVVNEVVAAVPEALPEAITAESVPRETVIAKPAMPSRQSLFESAAALEAVAAQQAIVAYRRLALGRDGWAANASYAIARLLLDTRDLPGAQKAAQNYLRRFPTGPNAADARELLRRLENSKGTTR